MDFFAHQDVARRNTRTLVVYFAMAVAAIIAAVYLVVAIVMVESAPSDAGPAPTLWNPGLFAMVALSLVALIGLGTAYKVHQMAQGGEFVARMLGGTRIDPSTTDPAERRLLNVVEEMAIAAGTPVPPVFMLEDKGINAFAAGMSPSDAIVGVTRGCATELTRDELQGVVAHEFSHILNGDMRLNLKLIGVLHGILLIALTGYFIFRSSMFSSRSRSSSRNSKGDGGRIAIVLLGLALMVIGYIGVFFSRLIKSAVSRQREFLADASSVQYTRNPSGIAGALKKIAKFSAGSRVTSEHAEETSHLFFANGIASAWMSLLATHPPLSERIRRIEGVFADLPAESPAAEAPPAQVSGFAGGAPRLPPPLRPRDVTDRVGAPTAAHVRAAADLMDRLPPAVRDAARSIDGAQAVVCALLSQPGEPEVIERQRSILSRRSPELADFMDRLLPAVSRLDAEARLPVLDLALATLRAAPVGDVERLDSICVQLVAADGRIDLFEFAVQRMIRRALDRLRKGGGADRSGRLSARDARGESAILLGALARQGGDAARAYAAAIAAFDFDTPPPMPGAAACGLLAVEAALEKLDRAEPEFKRKLMAACAECVASDGRISAGEGELLRAVAAALDCPLPLLSVG